MTQSRAGASNPNALKRTSLRQRRIQPNRLAIIGVGASGVAERAIGFAAVGEGVRGAMK